MKLSEFEEELYKEYGNTTFIESYDDDNGELIICADKVDITVSEAQYLLDLVKDCTISNRMSDFYWRKETCKYDYWLFTFTGVYFHEDEDDDDLDYQDLYDFSRGGPNDPSL